MAIICADTWQDWRGAAVTGDDLTSAAAICAAVDRAVREAIHPFVPDPVTVTSHVMDAPPTPVLLLPLVPARSVTAVYLRPGANGDPSLFTSDYLLTQFLDYFLPIDRPDLGYSRSGILRRRNAGSWGWEYRRPVNRLAPDIDPNRGAVCVSYLAGPASVPDDLFAAAATMVTKLMLSRKMGSQVASASLNGGSYSLPAGALQGLLGDPLVQDVIANYRPPVRISVGGS